MSTTKDDKKSITDYEQVLDNAKEGSTTSEATYFDTLITFIKDKILTTLSLVFVTFSILSNDETKHTSVKKLIFILLGLALFFLVTGLFELAYKIYSHAGKHTMPDIIIAVSTCLIYVVLLYVTIIYISLQYKTLNRMKFVSKY